MLTRIRIYHNNRCSKSRATLALLEGHEVEVVNYLDTPPDAVELKQLLKPLDISARQLLRSGEAVYKELGLADPALDDEALIAVMVAHPILIERPTVIANGNAAISRSPEAVLEILGLPFSASDSGLHDRAGIRSSAAAHGCAAAEETRALVIPHVISTQVETTHKKSD